VDAEERVAGHGDGVDESLQEIGFRIRDAQVLAAEGHDAGAGLVARERRDAVGLEAGAQDQVVHGDPLLAGGDAHA
jgi:hypothetical protein